MPVRRSAGQTIWQLEQRRALVSRHGKPVDGAIAYYDMNMVEKRAVELEFPHAIFITFSGREMRELFPDRLPIFYMYSVRKGVGVKPWFIDDGGVRSRSRTTGYRRLSRDRTRRAMDVNCSGWRRWGCLWPASSRAAPGSAIRRARFRSWCRRSACTRQWWWCWRRQSPPTSASPCPPATSGRPAAGSIRSISRRCRASSAAY